jgi:hypothetical protein
VPLPYRWLPGHWLCSALDRLATTIDPTTYLGLIRHPVRDGLIQLGAPAFIANVLGASSGYGLKLALGQRPVGQLIQTLRVLGALTCPNLAKCPSRREVVKTFPSPVLADRLRAMI